jgi:hypothetical protein
MTDGRRQSATEISLKIFSGFTREDYQRYVEIASQADTTQFLKGTLTAVCSTRLRRVVSGVTPETACGHSLLLFIRVISNMRSPMQFGGTPN